MFRRLRRHNFSINNVDRFAHWLFWLAPRRVSDAWAYKYGPDALNRSARDRFGRHAVISGGTDCDGMRYSGVSFHWTWKGADLARDDFFVGVEGRCGARIESGREGREWRRGYEPDTRDRFAEAMNY